MKKPSKDRLIVKEGSVSSEIQIPKYDLWDLSFKQFKEIVIDVFLKHTPFKKRALRKKVLKFKDDKAFDYYKCSSYNCYFNYMGRKYNLYLGYPPLLVMIKDEDKNYSLDEYMAIPKYEDIEECVKGFIENEAKNKK